MAAPPGRWSPSAPGRTTVTLTYQRELATGAYDDVYNGRRPVSVRVTVVVTR